MQIALHIKIFIALRGFHELTSGNRTGWKVNRTVGFSSFRLTGSEACVLPFDPSQLRHEARSRADASDSVRAG
jgi:hypothetical protein